MELIYSTVRALHILLYWSTVQCEPSTYYYIDLQYSVSPPHTIILIYSTVWALHILLYYGIDLQYSASPPHTIILWNWSTVQCEPSTYYYIDLQYSASPPHTIILIYSTVRALHILLYWSTVQCEPSTYYYIDLQYSASPPHTNILYIPVKKVVDVFLYRCHDNPEYKPGQRRDKGTQEQWFGCEARTAALQQTHDTHRYDMNNDTREFINEKRMKHGSSRSVA